MANIWIGKVVCMEFGIFYSNEFDFSFEGTYVFRVTGAFVHRFICFIELTETDISNNVKILTRNFIFGNYRYYMCQTWDNTISVLLIKLMYSIKSAKGSIESTYC